MRFTILKWDINANLGSLQPWNHFKLHKYQGVKHLVWGKLSIHIENHTLETYAVCAECHSSEVGEVGMGDEGLTVCPDCGSIEQGYKYLNKREFEKLVA